jgi:hypothetical protein
VGDREILETYSISASKNTLETDIFSSWAKIFVDMFNLSLGADILGICHCFRIFKPLQISLLFGPRVRAGVQTNKKALTVAVSRALP